MTKVAETVKNNPFKTALTVIPVLIGIVYFIWAVSDRVVTQPDLEVVKREIISEIYKEAANIRGAYLQDLELQLEDVEIEMETLAEKNEAIPQALRRKAKRLQRGITNITGAQ